jgi:hypothetical protein
MISKMLAEMPARPLPNLIRVATFAAMPIHDVCPPVDLPGRPFPWMLVAFGTLALVCLAGGWWWHLHPSGRARVALRANKPLSPLEQLDELIHQQLVQQGLIKEFFRQLSQILRRHLEVQFALSPPEETTGELLARLRGHAGLEPVRKETLQVLFAHCDLVKFAGHHPCPEEIEWAWQTCRSFISETRYEV